MWLLILVGAIAKDDHRVSAEQSAILVTGDAIDVCQSCPWIAICSVEADLLAVTRDPMTVADEARSTRIRYCAEVG